MEQLEQAQALEGYRSGDERKPEDDPRAIREIAQKQLLAEYLAQRQFASIDEMTDATVGFVGEPAFEAKIEERAREIERSFDASDSDLWSRYERPDRRKRLSDLVVRIEEAAAKVGHVIPRRPAIGTLPTFDINARAFPGPPDEGHIVVFESGVFTFSRVVGNLTAEAIDARLTDEGTSMQFLPPPAIIEHIGRHPQILAQFADLVFSQAILGSSAYTQIYEVPPEYVPFGNRFIDGIENFILAHEYGHIILGHSGVHSASERAHEQEIEADAMALEICTAIPGGAIWAYVGGNLFLSAVDVVEKAAATWLTGTPEPEPSDVHPPAFQRRRALAAALASSAEPHVLQGATRMADTIDWALSGMSDWFRPALERAYRKGYPPGGFRPRSEIEKIAAFEAFMTEGFQTS